MENLARDWRASYDGRRAGSGMASRRHGHRDARRGAPAYERERAKFSTATEMA